MPRYGMISKYIIPMFIPDAMPGVPLVKLFSSCVLHIAHCAITGAEAPNITKHRRSTLFNFISAEFKINTLVYNRILKFKVYRFQK